MMIQKSTRISVFVFILIFTLPSFSFATENVRENCDSCLFKIESLEKPFSLVGNWLFTREDDPNNKNPELNTSSWRILQAPGSWKKAYQDGKNFQVGWYQGVLEFNPDLIGEEVVFLINTLMAQTWVYLDGREIYKRSGSVNIQRYYSNQPIPIRFKITQKQHVLAIRVDCLNMKGIFQLPLQIRKYHKNDITLALYRFFGGEFLLITSHVLLFFSLFLLLVYLKTRYSLYLISSIALLFSYIYVGTGNDFWITFFSPEKMYLIRFLGMSTSLFFYYLFSQYYYKFFPKLNMVIAALVAVQLIFIVYFVFDFHIDLFQLTIRIWFFTSYLLSFPMLYILIRGRLNKKEGAGIILVGLTICVVLGTNDLFLALGIIQSILLWPFGLLFYAGCISWYCCNLFANTFVQNKHLLKESRTLNEELESHNRRLREIDRLKDEFLANTSHELRTPLNGIIGISESMVDGATGKLPKDTNENLNMITHSARRLANLVNDILDFSKMKNQDLQLQLKSIDMQSIVEVVLTLSKPLVGQKPVQLTSKIPDNLSFASADENRLQQILINLVGNAVKFTHEGEVGIDVEEKQDGILVSVRDTGIGIPKEKQSAIFKSFEQADGSTAREYGGTGLGLSVTRKLVELHGGKIEVESTEGMGSTFSFILPVSDQQTKQADLSDQTIRNIEFQEEPESDDDISISENITNHTGARTILVVDDEPVNIRVLKNYLSMEKYRVLAAQDGFQALDTLQKEKPDLIVLDLMMPRMSGYEVARRIREVHDASELPIVMLTAKNQIGDLVEGFKSGANDYLTKPFNKDELQSRIKNLLRLSYITCCYERFVPKDFLTHLGKESIIEVGLGDHVEGSMSVLFSDIRSFTALSEFMSPRENFDFLNDYLSKMEPVIRENNGFVDKFIGDAIMAIFSRTSDDAVNAGIGMFEKLRCYNERRLKAGHKPLHIGVGINTGHLMLGTIGAEKRMEGTVISDAVNLASRVEGMTKMYGASILISDSTYDSLKYPERFDLRIVDRVAAKGKKEPVTVWEVFNAYPPEIREARLKTARIFEEGVSLYYEKEFKEAQKLFSECMMHDPEDVAVQIYVERCMHYIKHGCDENWDGIAKLTTK